jgi:phosphopantetheinyl transferase
MKSFQDNEVHIWLVNLQNNYPVNLSDSETKRSNELSNLKRKSNYVKLHSVLNTIIKKYHTDNKVYYTKSKKPFINGNINVSLSYTDDLAVIGVSRNNLGLDLEEKKSNLNTKKISTRLWPDLKKTTNFYYYWCMTEALTKYLDIGLFKSAFLINSGNNYNYQFKTFLYNDKTYYLSVINDYFLSIKVLSYID